MLKLKIDLLEELIKKVLSKCYFIVDVTINIKSEEYESVYVTIQWKFNENFETHYFTLFEVSLKYFNIYCMRCYHQHEGAPVTTTQMCTLDTDIEMWHKVEEVLKGEKETINTFENGDSTNG